MFIVFIITEKARAQGGENKVKLYMFIITDQVRVRRGGRQKMSVL